MNAIKFIKEHGVDKAREVVEVAPDGATHLSDDACHYVNADFKPLPAHIKEQLPKFIVIDDLKRLVESVDCVAIHGHEKSKEILKNAPVGAECYSWSIGNSGIRDKTVELVKLKQAIADYESIYGGEHV